jgi:cholesterol transport system auxiliary component
VVQIRLQDPRSARLRRPLALASGALTAALGLAGCGSAPPAQPDRFYSLEPAALEGPAGPPTPSIVMVNDLAARGLLGGRQIVYRTREQPLVVDRYDRLLWAEPPTRALAQNLVNGLRAAQVFAFVAIPADRVRADYLLGGEVERFEHLPTDQPPRVVGTMNLALVRAHDRRSVASRQYSGEERVDGGSPEAMAAAFNRLAARLVAEAVRDLKAAKAQLARTRGP